MSAALAKYPRLEIPTGRKTCDLEVGAHKVRLTNLDKPFWPELGLAKRDLLQYYADVANVLLPHLADRAMVMKRYPHGASGPFFFMKRAPNPRPEWIRTCSIEHASGNVIDFPVIGDVPSLLWVINLGCIDLNQWYARCDDVNRPDYMHFDLDPTPGAEWEHVLDAALLVHEELDALKIPNFPKTTGSRGIHIYVPIARGPVQKQVWTFAKAFAQTLAGRHPELITAEYKVAKRPEKHVLVDYNQNAWGRTLASAYSVRPKPLATVSAPISWEEVAERSPIERYRLQTVPARVAEVGDLFAPLLAKKGRLRLEKFL
ncbi:MAG TPA: non-homologous end-joining DNA ligase [Bryobacteraceae bacterium]|nr:non-homologous end-joining DNA ligase [Bryobacteraceae bacterium]